MSSHRLTHAARVVGEGTDSPIEFIHGERYHPELSNKTIAKEVKRLIKEAIAAGLLPDMEVSVTSTASSITVRIVKANFNCKSQQHLEAKKIITGFMLAYQKQEHWINGDYIENNFSDCVEWWVS